MEYNSTTYLEDDDSIQMDIDSARSYINGTMDSDLGSILKNLQQLNNDLSTMQGRQYSTSGTKVDQSYLDFEAISNALSDFTIECNKVLDDINAYIDACARALSN